MRVPRLGEVPFLECARVHDHQAADLQVLDVDLQRGGVHGHEHVGGIARGLDAPGAEINLKRRYAEGGTRGRADLGRKVRKCREIVAEEGGRLGELSARYLHAIPGIAGKTHDDGFADLADG